MAPPLDLAAPVYLAGHTGLVGRALLGRLQHEGFSNLITRTSQELDLRDQSAVNAFFVEAKPRYVLLCAGRVGGILANLGSPGEFIYDNLMISCNVFEAARLAGVEKLLNLGSSCIYPRLAAQPIHEDELLSGPLEPTNRAYAVAKIAAIEVCDAYRAQYGCDFISAMPTNLYGPFDNFNLHNSHVLPALLRKVHDAKVQGAGEVEVWGSGSPRREFLHSHDMADACLFLLRHFSGPGPVNVGYGEDITIADLAYLIKDVVQFEGALRFDASKPDGTPRKLLDVGRLREYGWQPSIPLRTGIEQTYSWFLEHQSQVPER